VTAPPKDRTDIAWENTQHRGNTFPGLAWAGAPAVTQSCMTIVKPDGVSPTRGSTSSETPRFTLKEVG
jgi:hypothetical protein